MLMNGPSSGIAEEGRRSRLTSLVRREATPPAAARHTSARGWTDSLRRHDPDQVRGSAGPPRTLSAAALPCGGASARVAQDRDGVGRGGGPRRDSDVGSTKYWHQAGQLSYIWHAMSLVAPQRSSTLSAQVADQLRALIADGTWPLGSRIPAELRLTEELGVSRNTVREALRALVHTGLLEARPGDGTYVRADSELRVSLGRRVAAADLRDAFEARALLEREGARRAAERADADQIAELRRLLAARDAAKAAGKLSDFTEADFAFHSAV